MDLARTPRTINGYNVVHWTENGVSYWAISDLAAPKLEDFARLFRTTRPNRERTDPCRSLYLVSPSRELFEITPGRARPVCMCKAGLNVSQHGNRIG